MHNYKVGNFVSCCITGIKKYGIFVDIDHIYTGLIHISEISDKFINNINDYVKIGDVITAKIIDKNDELKKMKLSIKNINFNKNIKNKPLIQETGLGFQLLKENLPKWINEKKY